MILLSYDGQSLVRIDMQTTHYHVEAGHNLGSYHGRPFVTGGCANPPGSEYDCHAHTEILDAEEGWQEYEDYPYSDNIRWSAFISYSDMVFAFAGFTQSDIETTVAAFANDSWSRIGDLKRSAKKHNVIQIGNEVLIIGGKETDSINHRWYMLFNSSYFY